MILSLYLLWVRIKDASPAEESRPQAAGECRRLMPHAPSSHLRVYVGRYEINSPYEVEYLRSFSF